MNPEHKEIILNSIREIPDFPKKGIIFKDITTLMADAEAFLLLMEHLVDRYQGYNLDYIAGLDARGFIFGGILANRLNIGFIPIRKKGKLPYKTISEKYDLEYGTDEVEIHIDSVKANDRVLVIDDLIATGGTAGAAVKLIQRLGGEVVESCFIMELVALNGRKNINSEVYSVIED